MVRPAGGNALLLTSILRPARWNQYAELVKQSREEQGLQRHSLGDGPDRDRTDAETGRACEESDGCHTGAAAKQRKSS